MPSTERLLGLSATACVVVGALGLILTVGGATFGFLDPDPGFWFYAGYALYGIAQFTPVLAAGFGLWHRREWARGVVSAVLYVSLAVHSIVLIVSLVFFTFVVPKFSKFSLFSLGIVVANVAVQVLWLFLLWRASRFFTSARVRGAVRAV